MRYSSIAAGSARQRGRAWLTRLQVQVRRPGDFLFRGLTMVLVLIVLGIVAGVAWVLVMNSLPTIRDFGLRFLTNNAFDPVHDTYGVAPAIFGTFVTSFFALLFALPIGIGTAVFLVDFCPHRAW